jgi:hypothetical protein
MYVVVGWAYSTTSVFKYLKILAESKPFLAGMFL